MSMETYYHEAGHAILAYALDVPIEGGRVDFHGRRGHVATGLRPVTDTDFLKHAMISLAGDASARALVKDACPFDGCEDDQHATFFLDRAPFTQLGSVATWKAEIRKALKAFMEDHTGAIEAVASTLVHELPWGTSHAHEVLYFTWRPGKGSAKGWVAEIMGGVERKQLAAHDEDDDARGVRCAATWWRPWKLLQAKVAPRMTGSRSWQHPHWAICLQVLAARPRRRQLQQLPQEMSLVCALSDASLQPAPPQAMAA